MHRRKAEWRRACEVQEARSPRSGRAVRAHGQSGPGSAEHRGRSGAGQHL